MTKQEIKYFIKFLFKEPFDDMKDLFHAVIKPRYHVYVSLLLFVYSFAMKLQLLQWISVIWFLISAIILRWQEGDWRKLYKDEVLYKR